MTLSIDIIEGVIEPQTVSCWQELEGTLSSSLQKDHKSYPFEKAVGFVEHFEEYVQPTDPDFWKLKSVAHMMASPAVVSMAFYPCSFSNNQWLFLQKINLAAEKVGFFAPYLTEKEDIEAWGAMEETPNYCSINEANLNHSLEIIDEKAREQFRNILSCFLQDTLNQALCLTYIDPNEKLSTILWLKA